jgi:hypothetical protein
MRIIFCIIAAVVYSLKLFKLIYDRRSGQAAVSLKMYHELKEK